MWMKVPRKHVSRQRHYERERFHANYVTGKAGLRLKPGFGPGGFDPGWPVEANARTRKLRHASQIESLRSYLEEERPSIVAFRKRKRPGMSGAFCFGFREALREELQILLANATRLVKTYDRSPHAGAPVASH